MQVLLLLSNFPFSHKDSVRAFLNGFGQCYDVYSSKDIVQSCLHVKLFWKMCKVTLPLFKYSIRMKHSFIAKDFGKKKVLLILPKHHFHNNETEARNSRVTKSSYAKKTSQF